MHWSRNLITLELRELHKIMPDKILWQCSAWLKLTKATSQVQLWVQERSTALFPEQQLQIKPKVFLPNAIYWILHCFDKDEIFYCHKHGTKTTSESQQYSKQWLLTCRHSNHWATTTRGELSHYPSSYTTTIPQTAKIYWQYQKFHVCKIMEDGKFSAQ